MIRSLPIATEGILKKLEDFLLDENKIQLALVFGSFAKGTQTPTSDVDLACQFIHPLSIDEKLYWTDTLSQITGREVDLIDLAVATGTVLREAVTTGITLKISEPLVLAKVLKRMWLEHEDFEKQRQRVLADRRKKVFNG